MKTVFYFLVCTIIACSFYGCSASSNREGLQSKAEISEVLKRVADWQIAHFDYSNNENPYHRHDYAIDAWTNATLYIGMFSWSRIAEDKQIYMDWLTHIGNEAHWSIAENFLDNPRFEIYHADELCIGQFYLDMYGVLNDKNMLIPTRERVDAIMGNRPDDQTMSYRNKKVWSWCDALFMAPPVYSRLAQLTGDDQYLRFMDDQYKNTVDHLYSKEDSLFFRDDSYFDKEEANGKKIFWGRGNGWVAAGLPGVLKTIPQGSPYRPFYENLFKELISRLAELQDADGFWHASLLDPESYPSPETSSTALITYALAYGLNHQLLEEERYFPILLKAWNALVSSVDEEGKLGWVQPIGADPKKVTRDMTAVFGVGAFLMAGTEMYHQADN